MNPCAVVKFSHGSSCVRPKIGPYAIHKPASGPGAYCGRTPDGPWVNVSWSCGRGPINQRGEPPSSSVPQRSKAVPPGALALAWAVTEHPVHSSAVWEVQPDEQKVGMDLAV